MKNDRNLGLIPLINFGIIIKDKPIYRCAQPHAMYQYEWLKEVLGIKHIFNLRSEASIDSKFAKILDFNVTNILIPDHKAPSFKQAAKFMNTLKTIDEPVLIHCEHGHGRTSTFSVLTKILNSFTMEEAIKDEEERFHYKFKHQIQYDFLHHCEQFHKLLIKS